MADSEESKNVVLVVDDEPEIRRVATLALSMAGFKAQVAENGVEGFECFVKHQPELCLVVSDVVMPLVDGLEMANRILEIAPNTKILVMSGYSSVELEARARSRFAFIRKPFLPEQFIRKIREMLAQDYPGAV